MSKRSLLVLSSLALSGCEYFYPTVVPASDTSDPWAVVSLYFDGDHQEIRVGDTDLVTAQGVERFNHVTTDPYDYFFVLAAGVDSGGIAEVELHTRVTARCVYGSPNPQVLENWNTHTVTQAGSPGQTVDNGLYAVVGFAGADFFGDLTFCPDDAYLVTREWFSRTEDFHGNVAYYGKGKVTYWQY